MTVNNLPEMDLREFQEKGYLLEANRTFFHLLGLALFVRFDDAGNPLGMGIYDLRRDPEGFIFDDFTFTDIEKSEDVQRELQAKAEKRMAGLGFIVQPLEVAKTEEAE